MTTPSYPLPTDYTDETVSATAHAKAHNDAARALNAGIRAITPLPVSTTHFTHADWTVQPAPEAADPYGAAFVDRAHPQGKLGWQMTPAGLLEVYSSASESARTSEITFDYRHTSDNGTGDLVVAAWRPWPYSQYVEVARIPLALNEGAWHLAQKVLLPPNVAYVMFMHDARVASFDPAVEGYNVTSIVWREHTAPAFTGLAYSSGQVLEVAPSGYTPIPLSRMATRFHRDQLLLATKQAGSMEHGVQAGDSARFDSALYIRDLDIFQWEEAFYEVFGSVRLKSAVAVAGARVWVRVGGAGGLVHTSPAEGIVVDTEADTEITVPVAVASRIFVEGDGSPPVEITIAVLSPVATTWTFFPDQSHIFARRRLAV